MYILKVEKAPDTDTSSNELEFIYDDIVNSIKEIIPNASNVERKKNEIYIETTLNTVKLKILMKPIFSHHIEFIRFVSINHANK